MSLGAGALEGLVEPGNSSGRGEEVSIVTLQAATAQAPSHWSSQWNTYLHPILTQGREEWERKALQNDGKQTAKTKMTWKGQQASKRNARGAPAKLKRPPRAVLKEMTAGRHCLEINLA